MRRLLCLNNGIDVCIKDIPITDLIEKINNIFDVSDSVSIDNIDPLKSLIKINKILDSYCTEEYYFDLVDYNKIEIIDYKGNMFYIEAN